MGPMRRTFSRIGWALLIYFGILNGAVWSARWLGVHTGWGYLLAVVLGIGAMILWKKPGFFRKELFAKRKAMKIGRFLAILTVFSSIQLVFIVVSYLVNYTVMVAGASALYSGAGMYAYVCVAAPIMEELLFRGVVLRAGSPWGKRFAIFSSALLFGLFHCNVIQSAFAFCLGWILGYVAVEYHLIWAVVLHLFNNLVISDLLPRLGKLLLGPLSDLMVWGTIAVFSVAALIVLIRRQDQIAGYLRQNGGEKGCWRAFLTAPGIIALLLTLVVFTIFKLL